MRIHPLRRPIVGGLAMLLIACSTVASRGQEREAPQSKTPTSIAELLQKRRTVLKRLVEVQTQQYAGGHRQIDAVLDAQQELLLVELELGQGAGHEAKIKLLEDAVRLARSVEKLAEMRFKSGQVSQADLLRSQAERLKVETELLRERQKEKKD